MDNVQDNEFDSYDANNESMNYDGYNISDEYNYSSENRISDDNNNYRDDRDCCCCKPKMPPMVSTYSYQFTNIGNNKCPEKMPSREEMLNQIRCLNFAIVDISEYLNTHHNDERALCLHREYVQSLHELKEKYQRVYGPLSIYLPCNKWRWLEQPWPWERSDR